ncbi:hypothetical protein NQ318_021514 [Aromia moschata]|uniref:SCP domain-containing protein n=1 Tax=Aromia moschata TaxID=1265417 RepID=A0AAV8ZCS4_9CUCU|nr:hypothetical protein NQ318_021514 [Aromia moschata]
MSTAYGPGADWSNAIKTWFDEYKYYSYGGPVNSQNGHYTQLVWADSEFVGCGYTYYETNENFKYQKLYACNYGPAGNYVGQTPYKT